MRALRSGVLSPRLLSARTLLLAALLASAVFAGVYAAVTGLEPHRIWALAAVFGYAGALLAAPLPWRAPAAVLLALGTLLVPLGIELAIGAANPEIAILREAAARWLETGTPFPRLSGSGDPNSYNVYLPGLALFGLPSALFGAGPATDPRLYLGLAAVLLFGLLRNRRLVFALLSCPFVALQLVTGATDVPVLGCVCLGLVLAGRDRFAVAGLLIGFAAAMKALAWPAVIVLLVFTCARGGMRAGLRALAGVLLPLLVLLVPVIIADPHAFMLNAIELPLGGLDVRLTAGSPLPGHLLASLVPGGSAIAGGLLALAALLLGVLMLRRPPRDVVHAARWLALGLLLAVLLAPSSRYGYLVYPVGLLLLPYLELNRGPWARLGDRGERG